MERSIKELLIILRDNARVESTWFGLKKRIYYGLYHEAENLSYTGIISMQEKCILSDYMYKHKPEESYSNFYWWEQRLWAPRLKWLNELISSL